MRDSEKKKNYRWRIIPSSRSTSSKKEHAVYRLVRDTYGEKKAYSTSADTGRRGVESGGVRDQRRERHIEG